MLVYFLKFLRLSFPWTNINEESEACWDFPPLDVTAICSMMFAVINKVNQKRNLKGP